LLSVSSVRHALVGWSASQLCPCVLWFRVRVFLFQRTQNVLGYAQRAGLIEQHVHRRFFLSAHAASPITSPHPRLRVCQRLAASATAGVLLDSSLWGCGCLCLFCGRCISICIFLCITPTSFGGLRLFLFLQCDFQNQFLSFFQRH
jgi:hypothetical protein